MQMKSNVLAVVTVGALSVGLTSGMVPSASAAASSLTVTFGDSRLPHLTYADSPANYFGKVNVTGAPISNVRLEISGEGVVADPAVIEVDGPTASFDFGTTLYSTGGFHHVVVTVTSDDTSPVSEVGPLLYAPGGDPLPATGDLTGVAFGYTDHGTYEGGDGSTSRDKLLTFVNKSTALFGTRDSVRPRCRKPDADPYDGCVRYRYDKATGLVVVSGYPARLINGRFWISRGDGDYEDEAYSSERFLLSLIHI